MEVAGTRGPVIATGGIRSGLDMAKAITLRATCVCAPPAETCNEGRERTERTVTDFCDELRVAMFLSRTKSKN